MPAGKPRKLSTYTGTGWLNRTRFAPAAIASIDRQFHRIGVAAGFGQYRPASPTARSAHRVLGRPYRERGERLRAAAGKMQRRRRPRREEQRRATASRCVALDRALVHLHRRGTSGDRRHRRVRRNHHHIRRRSRNAATACSASAAPATARSSRNRASAPRRRSPPCRSGRRRASASGRTARGRSPSPTPRSAVRRRGRSRDRAALRRALRRSSPVPRRSAPRSGRCRGTSSRRRPSSPTWRRTGARPARRLASTHFTCTSSLAISDPSVAVSRSTYVPAASKLAVVPTLAGLSNVTVPGPDTFVQLSVIAPGGLGNPSSLAVPLRLAVAGKRDRPDRRRHSPPAPRSPAPPAPW